MILTKEKSNRLFSELLSYCKHNLVPMPHNKSLKALFISRIIIDRYHYVILLEDNTKYLCNNYRYLKKWTLGESLKDIKPLK